ncbi:MAG: PAS domain S-box protein [bacterium]|jgi:PAS domain S-box-containing protein|nr:PAS domain S-box protein [bacterium]
MIISLINNLALLLSLSICHIFILRRWPKRSRSHNILAGILFGFICIAGMMNPFNLVEGVFFDGRSIVASIVSFFYGPLTAVVLATIGSAYRISVGGNGALCGVGVITTSAFLGVVFHYWRQKDPAVVQPGFLYFFGILVHLSMMAWMLTIPISTHDYLSVAIPVMLLFPVGESLLGLFLIDQEKSVAAVKALEESEKRFRGVVENIPVGIAINTEVGDVEYFNKAFTQITGYTIQDVPTLDAWWPKAYPDPDKRARLQAFWLSVTTKAKDENQPIPASEYTIACKDGTVKSVMVQGLFTGGKFYTVFHDVTELEVMRRTLDNERRFLETVLETIDNGVIACNLDGIYTLFNRAAREMHEVPSSPAGQNDGVKKYVLYQADGVTPLEKDAVPLFRALNGEYVKNEEFVIRSSQGKECIVKASGKPLSDHDGQQIGAMVSLHDITLQKKTEEENRQLEEKFLQSQKMEAIGKLAGGIAHDFNNLLMAIKGYGELALLSIGTDSPVRQDIEEIIKAGDRAAALTHQLLAFSRKQILQPVNVNINDLV